MTANHFGVDGFDYVADVELMSFRGDERVKYDLEEQVAEFG